ncbi:hypothetical protein A2160_05330 [Candidatus Beckwithbacteria bacterium RBG_13_42_9]|uniref:Big-1 domain-containing protein n=1 Tax=Candidatus Beckwithbacteria bacterium RBG_13_42_9 TaxID=1797457 RepID=A0A1F5E6K2_9BACT|nr:MAG: hypothetical protein A2160_05330 [Candidatus Beckwithbacteria bacterium RBG_13_42_9]
MKNQRLSFALVGLFIIVYAALALIAKQSVQAVGGQDHACEDAQVTGLAPIDGNVNYTAPSGDIINQLCIKSGSKTNEGNHIIITSNGVFFGYTVSGLGTNSITITAGSDTQAISHADIYFGLMPSPTPSASPETSPSPSPEVSPNPSPETSPNPEPSSSPAASASPNPQAGKTSALGKNGPTCENMEFEVTYDAKENGDSRKDVEVTFTYRGETKKAKTDENGRARVFFNYQGEGDLKAEATDGYPSQSIYVQNLSCSASGQGGTVLGASTNTSGQVLGASTMADTGTSASLWAITLATGGLNILLAGIRKLIY